MGDSNNYDIYESPKSSSYMSANYTKFKLNDFGKNNPEWGFYTPHEVYDMYDYFKTKNSAKIGYEFILEQANFKGYNERNTNKSENVPDC